MITPFGKPAILHNFYESRRYFSAETTEKTVKCESVHLETNENVHRKFLSTRAVERMYLVELQEQKR